MRNLIWIFLLLGAIIPNYGEEFESGATDKTSGEFAGLLVGVRLAIHQEEYFPENNYKMFGINVNPRLSQKVGLVIGFHHVSEHQEMYSGGEPSFKVARQNVIALGFQFLYPLQHFTVLSEISFLRVDDKYNKNGLMMIGGIEIPLSAKFSVEGAYNYRIKFAERIYLYAPGPHPSAYFWGLHFGIKYVLFES